jgi:hypothetical protein
LETLPGLPANWLAETQQAYFLTRLRSLAEEAEQMQEIGKARQYAFGKPWITRAAYLALWQFWELGKPTRFADPKFPPTKITEAEFLSRLPADDLLAWAQAHRQMGEHQLAARAYTGFLARFPAHEKVAFTRERLAQEEVAAKQEQQVRDPEFTTMPMAPRPK